MLPFRLRRTVATAAVALTVLAGTGLASVPTVAGAAPVPTTPPPDHFLCYTAKPASIAGFPSFPLKPGAALLFNQFARNGLLASIGSFQLHCNPAEKRVTNAAGVVQTTPITRPEAHLTCWMAKENPTTSSTAPHHVVVTNQFGTGELVATPLKNLCLPTYKNEVAPDFPGVEPPRMDHYSCYQTKYWPDTTKKFRWPTKVEVRDQFGGPTRIPRGSPSLLCLPTLKVVDPAAPRDPVDLDGWHLMCFTVAPTVIAYSPAKRVFDGNQFGRAAVDVVSSKYLCLPSTKVEVHSA